MALESGTYISDLNPSNPVGATDKVSTLDDHVRLIKSTLQNTFPNIDGAVTATEDQINLLAATSPNDQVLRISGDAVGWGQLTAGMFPSQVVPDAALSNNVPLKNAPNVFNETQTIATSSVAVLNLTGSGSDMRVSFQHSGAPENQGRYTWVVQSNGTLSLQTAQDSGSLTGAEAALRVVRSAQEVTEVELNADALDFNGNADISGTLTMGGVVLLPQGSASAPSVARGNDSDTGIYWPTGNTVGISAGNSLVASFSQSEIDLTATTLDFNGNADISGSLTVGSARIASEGGVIYHDSTNNLGGKIVLSSSPAASAAQVGAPGDMRFVYS